MTKSQEKTIALQDFLSVDKKFDKLVGRLNHLLDKEITFQALGVPMPEGLKEELDEKVKTLGKLQMKKLFAEITLGFQNSIPHLN